MLFFLKKIVGPIFTSLQSKQENLKEPAKIQKFQYKPEKFHSWRNKTATEKLLLKFI